jgi:hypothetical protein
VTWQIGLVLVVIFACVLPWVVGSIIHDFSSDDDEDHVAARKRQIERNARRQSREFQ